MPRLSLSAAERGAFLFERYNEYTSWENVAIPDIIRVSDFRHKFDITPSLGGSESLVTQMWAMYFFDYSEQYRKDIGMVDNLVRLALGLEDVDDLIVDLKQALEKV